jgi:predicted Zn-dependent protease
MIDTIQTLLRQLDIDDWKLLETEEESRELFFIRKSLDMNRAKKVKKYTVTVYRHFEEKKREYTGSATIELAPTAAESEILKKLEEAFYAASFVRNPRYPLPGPSEIKPFVLESPLDKDDPLPLIADLKKSLYKNDVHKEGGINSAELFIHRNRHRFLNSAGIDVSFSSSGGDVELIVDWEEGGEGVELHNIFSFSGYDPKLAEEECREQIEHCRLRSRAKAAPDLKPINILISGRAVAKIMGFYTAQANARNKYEGLSKAEPGKVFQGENPKGDLLSITLDPYLPYSPNSAPYDSDGVALSPVSLYEKGILKQYHGSVQYCHYMHVPPTGQIRNIDVQGGSGRLEGFLQEPYVEILAFSDFQMDSITGNFGGEVRLARYFDGKEIRPITGASLSACLFDVQQEMYLSTDIIRKDHYRGPKSLLIPGGRLSGSEGS